MLKKIESLIGKKYYKRQSFSLLKELEKGTIPMDFLENLEGFDDWFLQEGYNLYMRDRIRLSVRKGIPRRPEEADDIIRWALARKDYVKYAEWLKTTYGSNWRGTFQSLVAQSNRINLSNAEKEAIDKLFTKGLLQFKYDELKKAFQLHRQTAKTRKKALDWAIDPKNAALVDALKREVGIAFRDVIDESQFDINKWIPK